MRFEKARSIKRHSAAPQIPVRRVLAFSTTERAISTIRSPVDINVNDPFKMGKNRHPRICLNPANKAFAATRHDHINAVRHRQHLANRSPVAGRYQLDRIGRKTCFSRPCTIQARISMAEFSASDPARRIAALPDLRHKALHLPSH